MMRHKLLIVLLLLSIFIGLAAPGTAMAHPAQEGRIVYAKVLSTENREVYDEQLDRDRIVQWVEVEVYSNGVLKGRTYSFEHVTGADYYKRDMTLSKGDRIKVELSVTEEGYLSQATVFDIVRYPLIFWLVGLFLILLVVVGRIQGLKTALSMIITLSAIVFVLLPMLKRG